MIFHKDNNNNTCINLIFVYYCIVLIITNTKGENPLVKNNGMADPHARAFGNAIYIYATHDYSPNNTNFRMDDWWIWKTTDLISYRKVQEFKPMEWVPRDARTECWATDAAEKNNNYYWYLSIGPTQIAVVKSPTSPSGPWNDVLKKPLLSDELGKKLGTTIRDPGIIYDPANKKHYIIFGTFNYYIAELGDDMMSLAEHPRKVNVINAIGNYGPGKLDDKPFIHKYNGNFYLSWGCFYGTSSSVYGPYTFNGVVIKTSSLTPSFRQEPNNYNKSEWWTNKDLTFRHGSFLSLHNQWYYFTNDITHSTDLLNKGYYRDVVAGYVHYYKNGSIAPVKIDTIGIGNYDGRFGKRIEVENYFKSTSQKIFVKKESVIASNDFLLVTNLQNNGSIFYPNIKFSLYQTSFLHLIGQRVKGIDIEEILTYNLEVVIINDNNNNVLKCTEKKNIKVDDDNNSIMINNMNDLELFHIVCTMHHLNNDEKINSADITIDLQLNIIQHDDNVNNNGKKQHLNPPGNVSFDYFYFTTHSNDLTSSFTKKINNNDNNNNDQGWGEIAVPLYSYFSKDGEYYLNVSIGAPPNTFLLQIDTGSSDLGIPKWGCTSCTRHADNRYVPSNSKTSHAVNCSAPNLVCKPCHENICSYEISYADSSGYSAQIYTDAMSLAGSSSSTKVENAYIGAIYEDHLKNPTQPINLDGIIGVAYSSISSSGAKTIIDTMYDNGIIKSNMFSICMHKDTGGMLYLGANDAIKRSADSNDNDNNSNDINGVKIQWTKIMKETYYVVNLLDFRINNISIGVNPSVYNRGDAIVDSGSSSFTLPRTAFDAFRDLMLTYCNNSATQLIGVCIDNDGNKIEPGRGVFQGLCYEMNEDDISTYPILTIQLENNVDLLLKPQMYMRNGGVFCDSRMYTIGIDSGSVTGGTLLGDTFMSSFLTIFDREHRQIGFLNSDEIEC